MNTNHAVLTKLRPNTAAAPSFDVVSHRWPLTPTQRWLSPWLRPIERVCTTAADWLGRPRLTPHQNTQRCYERMLDPLCADTGVWPDYTEGHFEHGDESYEDAKRAQFDFIFDRAECGPGTRLLDLGCGNGKLLESARERGCEVSGVTISRSQARTCCEAGLDVRVCSFDQTAEVFAPESFDVVVLNGPTEHFVGEDAAAEGREMQIHRQLFDTVARLLKPGGRVFITCIHFRWPSDVHPVLASPLRHPVGSYYFFATILVGVYSGWYPHRGSYERAADRAGLELAFERDATADYLETSRIWKVRLDRFFRRNPGFIARFAARSFWDDPRYFFIALLYWLYGPWSWQFRPTEGAPSPMIHRWLMFQRPAVLDE